MKTALLCWELGAGLGHLTPIKQLSKELIKRGYKVWIAARELHSYHHVFHDIDVNIIPAPVNRNDIKKDKGSTESTLSFADILHSIGYKNKDSLANHIQSWQALFSLIQADIIFFDHSPTAIIASQNSSAKKVLMGTPFSRPIKGISNHNIFSLFHQDVENNAALLQKARTIEEDTLSNINFACRKNNLPTLKDISSIFSAIDIELFSCLSEFDHYPNRTTNPHRFYLPTTSTKQTDKKPHWPLAKHNAKKIFVYITALPNLHSIINGIIASQHSTIMFINGGFEIKQALPKHIKIINQPLSMKDVLAECDLVITNCNLNTVQQAALAGLPQLVIPFQLEQSVLTQRLQQQGIVEHLDNRSPRLSMLQIQRLLSANNIAIKSLQKKYDLFDEESEVTRIFELIL